MGTQDRLTQYRLARWQRGASPYGVIKMTLTVGAFGQRIGSALVFRTPTVREGTSADAPGPLPYETVGILPQQGDS